MIDHQAAGGVPAPPHAELPFLVKILTVVQHAKDSPILSQHLILKSGRGKMKHPLLTRYLWCGPA